MFSPILLVLSQHMHLFHSFMPSRHFLLHFVLLLFPLIIPSQCTVVNCLTSLQPIVPTFAEVDSLTDHSNLLLILKFCGDQLSKSYLFAYFVDGKSLIFSLFFNLSTLFLVINFMKSILKCIVWHRKGFHGPPVGGDPSVGRCCCKENYNL